MQKKEIRNLYRKKRDELSVSQKLKNDDLILIQLQTLELPFLSAILSFYPLEDRNEINSFIITDYLHFKNPNLHIAYPKTDLNSSTMTAVICTADTAFAENEYMIPEPVTGEAINPLQLELVLIPLLGCDLQGNRVGYGKGFYDRFLKDCSDNCIKIGFSYFDPVDVIDDANEFDVPLDICITPQQVYVF